jgi:hypothetical protein
MSAAIGTADARPSYAAQMPLSKRFDLVLK